MVKVCLHQETCCRHISIVLTAIQQVQLRLTTTEEEKKIIQDQLKIAQVLMHAFGLYFIMHCNHGFVGLMFNAYVSTMHGNFNEKS